MSVDAGGAVRIRKGGKPSVHTEILRGGAQDILLASCQTRNQYEDLKPLPNGVV